jgi:hypothetical protein
MIQSGESGIDGYTGEAKVKKAEKPVWTTEYVRCCCHVCKEFNTVIYKLSGSEIEVCRAELLRILESHYNLPEEPPLRVWIDWYRGRGRGRTPVMFSHDGGKLSIEVDGELEDWPQDYVRPERDNVKGIYYAVVWYEEFR